MTIIQCSCLLCHEYGTVGIRQYILSRDQGYGGVIRYHTFYSEVTYLHDCPLVKSLNPMHSLQLNWDCQWVSTLKPRPILPCMPILALLPLSLGQRPCLGPLLPAPETLPPAAAG